MTARRAAVRWAGDPRARLALGVLGLAGTALLARQPQVGRREEQAFRLVNRLPDSIYPPAWAVMQLGNLLAAPATAAAAGLAGEPRLARRLLIGGSASWALSKVVKPRVGRPRPAVLLAGTRRRGREQSGLGYLSGHAAVAVALGVTALPQSGCRRRLAIGAAMPAVGLCRLYVGAHLPLDVVGGAALGLMVEAAPTAIRMLRAGTERSPKVVRPPRGGPSALGPPPDDRHHGPGSPAAWVPREGSRS